MQKHKHLHNSETKKKKKKPINQKNGTKHSNNHSIKHTHRDYKNSKEILSI